MSESEKLYLTIAEMDRWLVYSQGYIRILTHCGLINKPECIHNKNYWRYSVDELLALRDFLHAKKRKVPKKEVKSETVVKE